MQRYFGAQLEFDQQIKSLFLILQALCLTKVVHQSSRPLGPRTLCKLSGPSLRLHLQLICKISEIKSYQARTHSARHLPRWESSLYDVAHT